MCRSAHSLRLVAWPPMLVAGLVFVLTGWPEQPTDSDPSSPGSNGTSVP